MDAVRRVAKNTGILIAGRVVGEAIAAVTSIFLVRYLGATRLGVYSFVFAYLLFFSIIKDLGMGQILLRELSREKAKRDKLIGNGIIINIILSIVAIIFASLVISFLDYSFNIKCLVYIASLTFLLSFQSLYRLIFAVDLRMEYATLVDIIEKVLRMTLFFYLIFLKAPLIWFVISELAVIFPGFLLIRHFSNRFIKLSFKIDLEIWKYLFKESWPLVLMSVFVIIYHRIDQLMLFQMKGPEAVGYYSAAVKLPEVLVLFPAALGTSVFPLMSRYFKTSSESLIQTYTLSFKYLLMIIIPIAFGATILSRPIISLIYGQEFLPSASSLAILTWAEVFIFYSFVFYEVMVAVNKQRLYLLFTGSAAVANVLLNLLLIPRYGIVGASLATLIARIVSAGPILGHLLPATRQYNLVGCRFFARPLVASVIMGVYVYYLRFHLAWAIIGGAIVFILAMLLIGGINHQDFQLAKAVLKRDR